LLSPQLSNCATWATVYQRGVKIISVVEFAIMIITLTLCASARVLSTPSKAKQR
jgi:hypothetical protein